MLMRIFGALIRNFWRGNVSEQMLCAFSSQDIFQLFGGGLCTAVTIPGFHVALNREFFMEYWLFMGYSLLTILTSTKICLMNEVIK